MQTVCFAERSNPHVHSPCASGCHHPAAAAPDVAGPSSEGSDPSGPNGPYSRATLVICPLVAVIQWRQEIARYVAPNALRVSCLTSALQHASSLHSVDLVRQTGVQLHIAHSVSH